ncbi:hypothetical protein NJC40_27020 [Pseudomonas sp. 21LCFQ02]|uniref:hypothetical protein n=1 Tax=Pseudomonas sp. 21LCFQ02 TaxID=2957505 RepID=UPI00209BA64B|nr:hypothetical protein [Pseudomonas sp. 21LCFQ02]MCO8171423.1 hypothetical protein [Pseudomonas sp. 21LCFQ02]
MTVLTQRSCQIFNLLIYKDKNYKPATGKGFLADLPAALRSDCWPSSNPLQTVADSATPLPEAHRLPA